MMRSLTGIGTLLVLVTAACAPARVPAGPGPEPDVLGVPVDMPAAASVEPAFGQPGRWAVDPGAPLSPDAQAWVDRTLAGMSLREKVGQLVMPRIGGDYTARNSATFRRLVDWVDRQAIGGVIISIGSPLDVAAKLNAMQQLADVPLLVSADMEHGAGQILRGGGTRFPPLMALGATGDPRYAWELGRITAREARSAGVHIVFAPVVDVNNNPANPIINVRSYGADPELVARFARAHVQGLQAHGAIATAKHFPGHGDTGTDSHIELPIITVDAARADSVELRPYREAIDAGLGAVMSAHIAFPALTGDSVPATLQPAIMTGLLRERLGFDGLIVTDALDMGAIVRRYGAAEAPVLALEAGADILLQVMPNDVPLVIDAVTDAVRSGRIPGAALDARVRRVLETKARLGLHGARTVNLAAIPDVLGSEDHLAVADEIAARSITLVRDAAALVPLRAPRVLSVVFSDNTNSSVGEVLQRALGEALPELRTARLDVRSDEEELAAVRAQADSADVVLFSPFVRVSAYKGGVALPTDVAALIDAIARQRPTVVASFGNPYLISQLPSVDSYLIAWGQWEAPQRAAARALLGQAPITGRLPIPLPPAFAVGDGVTRALAEVQ